MASKSSHSITLTFTGDTQAVESVTIADNAVSPGQPGVYVNLNSGNNTITVPTGGAAVPVGVWVIPPTGNAVAMTVKGVTGDTGILIHLTNAHYQSLASGVATFVLNAASSITGVRLIWV